jgi:hypothetical protein
MTRVVCITNISKILYSDLRPDGELRFPFTIGKVYDLYRPGYSSDFITLTDDTGQLGNYSMGTFMGYKVVMMGLEHDYLLH